MGSYFYLELRVHEFSEKSVVIYLELRVHDVILEGPGVNPQGVWELGCSVSPKGSVARLRGSGVRPKGSSVRLQGSGVKP